MIRSKLSSAKVSFVMSSLRTLVGAFLAERHFRPIVGTHVARQVFEGVDKRAFQRGLEDSMAFSRPDAARFANEIESPLPNSSRMIAA